MLLSRILRHDLPKYPQLVSSLLPSGYIPLDTLLSLPVFNKKGAATRVSQDMVFAVVSDNDKQRFSLRFGNNAVNDVDAKSRKVWWIRANQGHSFSKGLNDAEMLEPIIPSTEGEMLVYHGTTRCAYDNFINRPVAQGGGLNKMKRNHLHLATGAHFGADGCKSGMRKSSEIVIAVNVTKAHHDGGHRFFSSANGVVLVAGPIETDFFEQVVDHESGKKRGNENE